MPAGMCFRMSCHLFADAAHKDQEAASIAQTSSGDDEQCKAFPSWPEPEYLLEEASPPGQRGLRWERGPASITERRTSLYTTGADGRHQPGRPPHVDAITPSRATLKDHYVVGHLMLLLDTSGTLGWAPWVVSHYPQ